MGRKSVLSKMPPEVQAKLDELLQNKAYTQRDVTRWMNEFLSANALPPVMTERIVNRYAASMQDILQKKRDTDQVVKAWVGQMGDIPDGDFGRAIVEILRTLSFELNIKLHEQINTANEDELFGFIKMFKEMAFSVEKLEKAASENEKRAEQIRLKARQDAAEELSEGLKNEGISEAVEQSIKRILLGA